VSLSQIVFLKGVVNNVIKTHVFPESNVIVSLVFPLLALAFEKVTSGHEGVFLQVLVTSSSCIDIMLSVHSHEEKE